MPEPNAHDLATLVARPWRHTCSAVLPCPSAPPPAPVPSHLVPSTYAPHSHAHQHPHPPHPPLLPLSCVSSKTTLMDVLAGRKTGGTITGEMHIKGLQAGGWVSIRGWLAWGRGARGGRLAQELEGSILSFPPLPANPWPAGAPRAWALPCQPECSPCPAPGALGWLVCRQTPADPAPLASGAGFPKEQRTFARVTGYVEQDDSHLPQVHACLQGAMLPCFVFILVFFSSVPPLVWSSTASPAATAEGLPAFACTRTCAAAAAGRVPEASRPQHPACTPPLLACVPSAPHLSTLCCPPADHPP